MMFSSVNQSLIIGASQNCWEGKWTIYDHRFRLKASASRSIHWLRIDITIWNMSFPDRTISGCQSSVVPHDLFEPNFSQWTPRSQFLPKTRPICLDWNDNPNGYTYPTYLSIWSSVLSLCSQTNIIRLPNALLDKEIDSKAIAHNWWLLVVTFMCYLCIIFPACWLRTMT